MIYQTELQSNNEDLRRILNKINALPEAGGGSAPAEPVLQVKSVTPTTSAQVIEPDNGYDGLSKVTVNAMPTATQATPSIEVNSSGLITAKSTQSAGYVAAGTKQATKQLTVQAAKTVTPGESSQTAVAKDRYTTGAVTVAPIPDGYMVGDEIAAQDSLISQITTALQGKAAGGGAAVETCTVTIDASKLDCTLWNYAYTAYENSQFVGKASDGNWFLGGIGALTAVLNNVVCGTVITVVEANSVVSGYCTSSDESVVFLGSLPHIGALTFTAPTTSGVHATVTLDKYVD